MNTQPSNATADHWWFAPAGAGIAAAAAIVAIVTAPVGTQAKPADPAPVTIVATIPEPVEPVERTRDRQCFIEQARWNVGYDGPVPRC